MSKFVRLADTWSTETPKTARKKGKRFVGELRTLVDMIYMAAMHRGIGAHLDQQKALQVVAKQLLARMDEDPDSVIDDALIDRIWSQTKDPADIEHKLLADALYVTLRMLESGQQFTNATALAIAIPLARLDGFKMAAKWRAAAPRKLPSAATVRKHREAYIRRHKGSARGWSRVAADELDVSVETMRRWVRDNA